jgi:hypothetical protein
LKEVEVARAAIRTGDLAAARTALESLVAAEPGLGEPQSMLASVRARMGDFDGALAVLEAQLVQAVADRLGDALGLGDGAVELGFLGVLLKISVV